MKYYAIEPDTSITMRLSASNIFDSGHETHVSDIFEEPGSLKEKINEPLTVILHESTSFYNKSQRLTDVLDLSFPGRIPCYSVKCKNLFESLDLPLEYHKVQIKGKGIEIIEGYYVAKLTGDRLECVDYEKSIIQYFPLFEAKGIYTPWTIEKLALDQTQIPSDTNMFVLGLKDWESYFLWISEEVKNHMEQIDLTGFKYTEVGEYKL